MDALLKRLGGKTKLFSSLGALVTVAYQLGILKITPEQYAALMTLFGTGVIHGLRDALKTK